MNEKKYLIVNADDFGQSGGVNRGIMKAHQQGIVTSASLMVRWPDATGAAAYGKEHSDLSLGLHLDLGEWFYSNQNWVPLYEVVPLNEVTAVEKEVSYQVEMFHQLVGKKPTHIDSHQHVHLREPVRSVAIELARTLSVPLRRFSRVHYCGTFYGQTEEGTPFHDVISVDGLINILSGLRVGITELSCHPGDGTDLNTMYRIERAKEVEVLCDPQVRAGIFSMDIQLCSFNDIANPAEAHRLNAAEL